MAIGDEDDVEGLPMEGENPQEPEVEQEPDVEIEEEAPPKETKGEKKEERIQDPQEEEPDEQEEERHKPTSKERREKRRLKERRIREERDYLVQQNQEILRRLAQVEGSALETRMVTVDSQLQECLNDAATAENLELDAQQQSDYDGVRQARRLREAAQNRANIFKAEKERIQQALTAKSQKPPAAAPPGAAEIQALAAQFRADKPWLQFAADGSPANDETAVALTIDRTLKKEGRLSEYDAKYWEELGKRVKSALPQMFGEVDDDGEDEMEEREEPKPVPKVKEKGERKGPVVGSSGAQGNSQTVRRRISPDRVAALKELGVWDDPKERASYLAEFDRWDKEHGVQR